MPMPIGIFFTVFNTLTLKQIFWKMKTFFKKVEYRYVVKSTTIESITYSWKNRLLRKLCFSIRTFYKESIWSTNYPNVHIHTSRKCCSFHWGCFLPVSIRKTYSAATIRNNFNMNVSCIMRAVLLFLHVYKTVRNRSQLF